ncbi:hypothetical protein C7974DRAFT_443286 [Boeremia exigua]|uniref:uncharacterized protein n=1 Tax=Boeremia exigua TaxID=749465 RepID=UPI001E8EC4EB|nr:uncharacterized protein C7974DRAFT_443286 [Boeremia exigua]KAH6615170.1 hypothetical protein C7974DRAFT_443286 [Boeremia exigua]
MSVSALTVRWLASTGVVERQEATASEQHEGELGHEENTQEQEEKEYSTSHEENDDRAANSRHEDDEGLHHDQVATPTSDSTEESDSGSDTSTSTSSLSTSAQSPPSTSCIQEAQLSPDGTCIFTSDYARAFSVYPLSTDILSAPTTQPLTPYARFQSADPIWAFACNPLFNLQDPSSTHVLISRRDRYITLHNALWDVSAPPSPTPAAPPSSPVNIHTPLTSYKLTNPLTEAVTAPLSLAYSPSGTHFHAGATNALFTFDLSHPEAPVTRIPTIPSARTKLKGGGRGFKGAIAALAAAPQLSASHGLVAAGARTRHVGLYDARGAEVTHVALGGVRGETRSGAGVTGLRWSACGRYLYVGERDADVLLIYDARSFAFALGCCGGRAARGRQRLGFDVWSGNGGESHEVWAGGVDGKIRVWRDPQLREGVVEADEVVGVGGGQGMPVVSALVHPSGTLAVAARGTIQLGDDTGGGVRRGGGRRPRFSERGCLDILGLSGY